MNVLLKRFVAVLLLSSISLVAAAERAAAPVLAANAWLLLDFGAGQVLAQHEAEARVEPASLTKLMTAYLTFSALEGKTLSGDQIVPVSEKAWKMIGSRMFIEPRHKVTVDELLRGMIIQSGNDASVALAEAIAGSEEAFAVLMNREAARLGMTGTNFTNASGLPDDQHYTTARDLGILASAIVRDFPDFYTLYSQKEYTYNEITQPNRNRLLWMDETVDGMKTGHTEAAGYCLVSSAVRGPRRLISVVLGTSVSSTRSSSTIITRRCRSSASGRVKPNRSMSASSTISYSRSPRGRPTSSTPRSTAASHSKRRYARARKWAR